MIGKNPREPKAVRKLIRDSQQQQVDRAVVRFIKGIITKQKQQPPNGGGTRKEPRG